MKKRVKPRIGDKVEVEGRASALFVWKIRHVGNETMLDLTDSTGKRDARLARQPRIAQTVCLADLRKTEKGWREATKQLELELGSFKSATRMG